MHVAEQYLQTMLDISYVSDCKDQSMGLVFLFVHRGVCMSLTHVFNLESFVRETLTVTLC